MENTTNKDASKFLLKLVDCRLPELEEQETTNDNKREACYKEHHKEPTKHQ
jgi:hypothetical protein